jgi:hypothetical protein
MEFKSIISSSGEDYSSKNCLNSDLNLLNIEEGESNNDAESDAMDPFIYRRVYTSCEAMTETIKSQSTEITDASGNQSVCRTGIYRYLFYYYYK